MKTMRMKQNKINSQDLSSKFSFKTPLLDPRRTATMAVRKTITRMETFRIAKIGCAKTLATQI